MELLGQAAVNLNRDIISPSFLSFAIEVGATITAPFVNPNDLNVFPEESRDDIVVNVERIRKLTFEDFSEGQIVMQAFGEPDDLGPVMVHGTNPNLPDTNAAIIFDSSCLPGSCSGGDDDLRTPGDGTGNISSLGQLLIIADNLVDTNAPVGVDDPNDHFGGGTIELDFSNLDTGHVMVVSMTVIDIERPGSTVELFDKDGNSLEEFPLPTGGDNSVTTVPIQVEDVEKMVITLELDSGKFSAVSPNLEDPKFPSH